MLGVPETLRDDRLGHHPPGVRFIYDHPTPAMRATMIAEPEARRTQVATRAGVDVERQFADHGGGRVGEQGRGGATISHARCGRGAAVG